MNNDLISRKVLLDELNSLRVELNGISRKKEFNKIQKEIMNSVIHIVEDQPTEFDKEKVIEMVSQYNDLIKNYALNQILEVIKEGGIE